MSEAETFTLATKVYITHLARYYEHANDSDRDKLLSIGENILAIIGGMSEKL